MLVKAFHGQALWSYVFGTSDPPEGEAAEKLEHLHWDRASRSWVAAVVLRDEIAA